MVGPAKDFVRGSMSNHPFRPGGLDDTQSLERTLPDGASYGEWVRQILIGGPAQAVPPSFKQGLDLGHLKAYPCLWNVYQDQSSVKTASDEKQGLQSELSVQVDDLFKKAWEEDVEYEGDGQSTGSESVKSEDEATVIDVTGNPCEPELSVLDEILSVKSLDSKSRFDGTGNDQQPKEAWAVTGSTEWISENFYDLVPDIFLFQLDTFQKEAIYYLEKGESVFVAAHMSLGRQSLQNMHLLWQQIENNYMQHSLTN